jgi:Tfp pilus assembly protein PilE
MSLQGARIASNRNGMTLIELLTSVAICLALSVISTVAFVQVRAVLLRMQIRLEMHNSARFLYQQLSEQISAMQQDGAMWIESTQDDGTHTGQLTITFLKGKADEHDFTTASGNYFTGEQNSVYQNRCTDLTWSAWHWDQKHAILSSGTTSPPRQFHLASAWKGPHGNYGYDSTSGNQGTWMANMPQPLRSATPYPAALPAGSSQAALGGNRYGSPDYLNDISDYQDLQNHLSPVLRKVTGCTIELILNDGSVIDADVTQTRILPIDGSFVDAHANPDATGKSAYLKRPRLIRVLIDMTDKVTGISQSFSFSFQPPAMLPLTYPAGNAIP